MIYDLAGQPLYRPGDNAANSPSVTTFSLFDMAKTFSIRLID